MSYKEVIINSTNGNAALLPKRIPTEKTKPKYNPKKVKREKQRENRRLRRYAIGIFSCSLPFFLILGRYSQIYNTQKQMIEIKNEIHAVKINNQDLKFQLLQVSNIKDVETIAVNELKMVRAKPTDVVFVDLNSVKLSETEVIKKETGIIDYFKELLF